MKRLSKAQLTAVDLAASECKEAADELEKAVDAFNAALEPLKEAIETAVQGYNSKLQDLKGLYESFGEEAREYYDERSERWQEGDAGSTYQEWLDQLESPDLEEIEIELPDELEMPDAVPDFTDMSNLPPVEPGM